ncbi:MAG: hypothetical protein JF613_02615, partial [Acidobacteria bacterium]|nr:hypothetical protein [Acidobacteriota bacterium]
MTSSVAHKLAIAVVVLTAAMPVPSALAQAPASQLHLLDVPYLPQSESLCGGAAIAMVMRYWGTTNVYAETFADLVDRSASGIRGGDLVAALRSRGWDAQSISGDPVRVQARLSARQPVVALIQDRPGRFHYADNWTLIARPAPGDSLATANPLPPAVTDANADNGGACGDLLKEGIRLAGGDDAAGARQLFEMAAAACPDAAGPWREMAGLHALAAEWPAAASDARRALSKDEHDALAARILATALFLDDDVDGALAAWNRVGEPTIDLINVTGLERTRFAVVAQVMGLEPQTVLTHNSLVAARRRLAELPSAQTTRVTMRPGENGRTQVDASVLERPLLPTSAVSLSVVGLHALTDHEAAVTVASPTGGVEAWTATWRWWQHRPKVAVAFDSAAPFGGFWGVNVFSERQTYEAGGTLSEETRRRAEFHVSNWTTRGLRWEGVAALDRFASSQDAPITRALELGGSVQRRLDDDRATFEMRGGAWVGLPTWTFAVRSEWRSNTRNEGTVWLARAEDSLAASNAPLALWPGAGTGQGRDALLRAHPLIDDGIIGNAVFGRHLMSGGVEGRRWRQLSRKPVRFAPALFLDV